MLPLTPNISISAEDMKVVELETMHLNLSESEKMERNMDNLIKISNRGSFGTAVANVAAARPTRLSPGATLLSRSCSSSPPSSPSSPSSLWSRIVLRGSSSSGGGSAEEEIPALLIKPGGGGGINTASSGIACSFHRDTCPLEPLVETGTWYYEVTVQTSKVLQVGWSTSRFDAVPGIGHGCGDDMESWAYDGGRQQKWHGKGIAYETPRWKTGDVVGCYLQVYTWLERAGKEEGEGAEEGEDVFVPRLRSRMWFSLNGRMLPTAFEDFHEKSYCTPLAPPSLTSSSSSPSSSCASRSSLHHYHCAGGGVVGGGFFPTISMDGGASAQVNFGKRRPFQFAPERLDEAHPSDAMPLSHSRSKGRMPTEVKVEAAAGARIEEGGTEEGKPTSLCSRSLLDGGPQFYPLTVVSCKERRGEEMFPHEIAAAAAAQDAGLDTRALSLRAKVRLPRPEAKKEDMDMSFPLLLATDARNGEEGRSRTFSLGSLAAQGMEECAENVFLEFKGESINSRKRALNTLVHSDEFHFHRHEAQPKLPDKTMVMTVVRSATAAAAASCESRDDVLWRASHLIFLASCVGKLRRQLPLALARRIDGDGGAVSTTTRAPLPLPPSSVRPLLRLLQLTDSGSAEHAAACVVLAATARSSLSSPHAADTVATITSAALSSLRAAAVSVSARGPPARVYAIPCPDCCVPILIIINRCGTALRTLVITGLRVRRACV